MIEAGHLAQSIMLIAEEMSMGSSAIGGYIDNDINELLDIKHTKEVALYLVAIGKIPGKPSQ